MVMTVVMTEMTELHVQDLLHGPQTQINVFIFITYAVVEADKVALYEQQNALDTL